MDCIDLKGKTLWFQSPQWGSNSKDLIELTIEVTKLFQSPQWGSNSKEHEYMRGSKAYKFQSPQWGSNSKEKAVLISQVGICFSPRNGEVILKPVN